MSSGSESDEDYVPGEPEKLSEEESADEETDLQFEKELEHTRNKRIATQSAKGKKKRKIKDGVKEVINNTKEEPNENLVQSNPEEEKKREEDLWAKFLEGTDTKPKPVTKELNTQPLDKVNEIKKDDDGENIKQKLNDKEKRIFEFAGETIVVENNTIKDKIKTPETADTEKKLEGPSRGRGGGLSNLLGQLNKKNKLSTLEKSKLDWNTYKKEEGIEEEIVSHNKGKAGYLDRRDFLERTDVRQYEIERDLRMSRRSNR